MHVGERLLDFEPGREVADALELLSERQGDVGEADVQHVLRPVIRRRLPIPSEEVVQAEVAQIRLGLLHLLADGLHERLHLATLPVSRR